MGVSLAVGWSIGVTRYQAGFIVLVTTNLSELCMWYESNNKVGVESLHAGCEL
jgi:hypothetical protein